MFIVKATYRGETRKVSFSADVFPSFEQLCNQLYRVFPISHNYYLSKLLFSPNATQGGRILIGREVHTREDYNKSIQPYRDRVWPQGLLRFSVYDDTSHKIANRTAWPSSSSVTGPSGYIAPPTTSHNVSSPPILYSAPSISNAMDVDKGIEEPNGKAVSPYPCCSVQSTKADIERLITEFKEDLDHVLKASFVNQEDSSPSPPLSVLPLFAPSTSALNIRGAQNGPPALCSICARRISSWNICDRCHLVECDGCSGKTNPLCLGSMASHQWDHRTTGSFPLWHASQGAVQEHPSTVSSISMPWSASTEIQSYYNRNNTTPVAHRPMPTSASDSSTNIHSVRPVIHHGVICDSCENTIEGIRHKCLDCPDYDLCAICIASGGTERHNPFHEFFEVATPGRVVIHRVYDRESGAGQGGNTVPVSLESLTHHAICNLCDSQIRGDRYKCSHCPDFDTCSSCFSITETQHPNHSFVKLGHSEDYIKRDNHIPSPHYATCNVCTKRIYGVRYKCMHADCPDFDLCSVCESHPIALHPEPHPLLKMKTPECVIPKICRHEASLVDLVAGISHEPASAPSTQSTGEMPRSPELTSRSFIWGFMHAPSALEESDPQTPLVQPSLIPRLDEISPSISRTVPVQEAYPFPILPYPSESLRVGSSLHGTHVLAGVVEDDNSRQTTPSPVRVPQGGISLAQASESVTWPGSTAGLERFMRAVSPPVESDRQSERETLMVEGLLHSDKVSEFAFTSSPLTGEETLLKPPSNGVTSDMQQKPSQPVSMSRQTLAMLLSGYQSPGSVESFSLAVPLKETTKSSSLAKSPAESLKPSTPEAEAVVVSLPDEIVEGSVQTILKPQPEPLKEEPVSASVDELKVRIYLSAMFVEDSTVSDGQVFPPGAEFMKCWRMLNDSEHDWPETTQLVYVAGEMLGMKKDGVVHIGAVKSGTEVELWTGELKAPDVAGRYVSYWRLRDGDGMLFGDSIWIDIVVADAHSSDESDRSIASSLVIMPQALPSASAMSVVGHQIRERQGEATATLTNGTGTSTLASLSLPSSGSGIGSDTESEVSLVSIPSSDEGEVWEDVGSSVSGPAGDRNAQVPNQAIDYVLLYDDRSSSEE